MTKETANLWHRRPIHRVLKRQDFYGFNSLDRIHSRGRDGARCGFKASTIRDIIIPDLCRVAAKHGYKERKRMWEDIINYGNLLATGIYY